MSSPLRSAARSITMFVLDAFFPKRCVVCNALGAFLCKSCLRSLPYRAEQTCAHCAARTTPNGDTCFDCREKTPLDGIFATARYDCQELAETIHCFKYSFLHELAVPLGHFLSTAIERSDLAVPDIILPVPLHPRRERWRGWNQSLLLAQELCASFPSDIAPKLRTDILVRTRFTAPQMSIGRRVRRESNVLDAFDRRHTSQQRARKDSPLFQEHVGYQSADAITGKNMWLIDDVAASGSTLRECAKVLKHHGAREVRGIVLAR